VRNQSGQLFAEVAKEAGAPLTLAFPVGTYTVTAVTPQKSLSSRVVLTSQGATSITSRDFQEQELARFAVRGPAPAEPDPVPDASVNVDLVPFGLGFVPGFPGSGWGGRDKHVAVSALVDFTSAVSGFQAAGIMSINAETFDGLQVGGVGSISRGSVKGMQYGGVFTIAGDGIHGIQFGGVFNISGGAESGFWQSAGVFNLARGNFQGVQTAGVLNIADTFSGVQASVVNIAGEVKGFQVGLVNINSHIDGAGLGLVYISPDAYYHPSVLYDSQGKTHAVFQWGMGWLYWLTALVADTKTSGSVRDWEQLSGVGVKVQSRVLFWDTDAGWSESFQANIWQGGRPYLRSAVGLQSGWFAVEAGLMATPGGQGQGTSVGPFGGRMETRWFAGMRFF